jgi:predicted transcriptional regulator
MKAKRMLGALRRLGWSDHAIARSTRVSQPTITRIRNGVQKDPKQSTVERIEKLHARQVA